MSKIITVPFTEEFLPHVVDYIYRYYSEKGGDLSRLCLVFGGRRPQLFIKKELARRIGRAFVPPKFFTIDDWMAYVAYGLKPFSAGSELDHCYTIYRLARELCPWVCHNRETFAQFLPWAREILHFIEQLDLEDVPSESLSRIKEHAQIGYSVPEDINKLLMNLFVLRGAYHRHLQQRQLAPRGFRYLEASRRVSACDLSPFDEILFCNFFYLHRTENAVIRNIYGRASAVLFMQGDQRRWPALERIAKTFGTPILEGPRVKPGKFELKVYEAFDSHLQAGMVNRILQGIGDIESTVIVLPDGEFLLTLLTALGEELGEFNISMGYPLKRSALYTLLTLVIEAQNHRKGSLYYTRDYLRLLGQALVRNLSAADKPGLTRVLVSKIEEVLKGEVLSDLSGRIFLDLGEIIRDEKLLSLVLETLQAMDVSVSLSELKKEAHLVHQVFFKDFENICSPEDLARALGGFVDLMQSNSAMDQYPFNAEIALRMKDIADELASCSFAREVFEPRELFRVLKERLSAEMVAFSGSPLKGVQILGLFETRALNFKNVIVVDVNEGLLPNLNIYEPLIPREVMIKLDLDRLELEEEIQRYGFMRLISAAQNVHLIYQQNNDRVRSRFLEELIWEKEQRLGVIGGLEIIRGAFDVSVEKKSRSIPKTASMLEYLKSFRFSSTSINTYLKNPYAFYCQYILGLRPKDDLLDNPEARHIGTFIHDLLEEAFGGFVGKKPLLDETFRKYFQKIYESKFAAVFGRAGRSDAFLMETVLKTRLERFLNFEAARCRDQVQKVLWVEKKFEETLTLAGQKVHWTYRVDRVDELTDGTILILDYKTGSVESMPQDISGIPGLKLNRDYIREHVKSFQMPLYADYLCRQFPGCCVNSALYYLRTTSMDLFFDPSGAKNSQERLGAYKQALEFITAEIFNLEIPFVDDSGSIK
ncbi:MAG: PD-(D/E)XK nuclease family protein [Candidatus Omnitrophica bacterium]|nr:PD-(D/E)XK nuclease family protein [Candidatus Omnitrophota bacterium]